MISEGSIMLKIHLVMSQENGKTENWQQKAEKYKHIDRSIYVFNIYI